MNFYLNEELPVKTFTLRCNNGNTWLSVSCQELGYILDRWVKNRVHEEDDAGCNWVTDNEGNTYIEYPGMDEKVSSDPEIATLINAANLLILGRALKLGHSFAEHAPKPTPEPTVQPQHTCAIGSCTEPGVAPTAPVFPGDEPLYYCKFHAAANEPEPPQEDAPPPTTEMLDASDWQKIANTIKPEVSQDDLEEAKKDYEMTRQDFVKAVRVALAGKDEAA